MVSPSRSRTPRATVCEEVCEGLKFKDILQEHSSERNKELIKLAQFPQGAGLCTNPKTGGFLEGSPVNESFTCPVVKVQTLVLGER